jgi:hypothetical protein
MEITNAKAIPKLYVELCGMENSRKSLPGSWIKCKAIKTLLKRA